MKKINYQKNIVDGKITAKLLKCKMLKKDEKSPDKLKLFIYIGIQNLYYG